jgi:hypothetical protein
MQSLAQARWKRVRAVELAVEGKSYAEIARQVGFSHRGSAHRAVTKALAEREVHAVEALRQVELDRLDQLHRSYWSAAVDGDRYAAAMVLKVMDRRIRLLGLQDHKPDAQSRILVRPGIEGNPGQATAWAGV